jgi:hypothetical protein
MTFCTGSSNIHILFKICLEITERKGVNVKKVLSPIIPVWVAGEGLFNLPSTEHSVFAWFELALVTDKDNDIEDYSAVKKLTFTSGNDFVIDYGDLEKYVDGWGEPVPVGCSTSKTSSSNDGPASNASTS